MEALARDLAPADAFAERLAAAGEAPLAAMVARLHDLVRVTRASPEDLRRAIEFLTEVGHHSDDRRQEWVLLADVLGVSTLVEDMAASRPAGATPNTLAGPFYRRDTPEIPNGGDLSRDGCGERLSVRGRVRDLRGAGVAAARVKVWHANTAGRYENQEPDLQPEFNLRGWLRADEAAPSPFAPSSWGACGCPRTGRWAG